jgi:hypothetical protein
MNKEKGGSNGHFALLLKVPGPLAHKWACTLTSHLLISVESGSNGHFAMWCFILILIVIVIAIAIGVLA